MPTHTETAPSTAAFTTAWQEWHAAHERHRADPHGFLAVTHLHWLGSAPAVLEGVPGAWRVKDDAVVVVLSAGESLRRDGQEVSPGGAGGTVSFGPIAERESTSRRGRPSSNWPSVAEST